MSDPITPAPAPPPLSWPPPPPGDGTGQVVVAGVLAGLALPVLYVAWLNRGGPGEVCELRPEQSACFDAWNPWPFVAVAVLLLVAAGFLVRAGLHARADAVASGAHVLSLWFGAGWVVVGLMGCFGVLSLLTVGIFILPLAVALAAVLVLVSARRRDRWR